MLKELVAVFPVSGSKNRGGFQTERVFPNRPSMSQGLGFLSAAPSLLLLLVVSCLKTSALAKPSPGCVLGWPCRGTGSRGTTLGTSWVMQNVPKWIFLRCFSPEEILRK